MQHVALLKAEAFEPSLIGCPYRVSVIEIDFPTGFILMISPSLTFSRQPEHA
jgi:hypothetical protein